MATLEVTRWFFIDFDGNPVRPGWYEVLYEHHSDKNIPECFYWDGSKWRAQPKGETTVFGNWSTHGERWRGLANNPEEK